MATFFVGQRVRKVRGENSIGATGVVEGFDHQRSDKYIMKVQLTSSATVSGEYLSFTISRAIGPGESGWARPDDWEAIQYDGMQPAEWSECLWQPEGVSA